MMKSEFENMALRNNTPINSYLYDSVEYFYMSENDYHRTHGGVDETKQDFVKRVFGGKVNTPKTVAKKLAEEAIRENRYALRGTILSEEKLSVMDQTIREHYEMLSELED